jgi:small subunit ribosomal protein S17
MENKKKTKKTEVGTENIAGAKTEERVGTRGRIFQGKIIKKFPKRVVIEFERLIYVRKYERYMKSRTKIHARTPLEFEDKIKIGDTIKVQECRPLSKIIHFLVIEKVKDGEEVKQPLEEKK